MEPLTLITEIKALLPASLTGEHHQRLPFSQGQLLHGVISAKGEANHFTVEINGQQISAESTAPLQVGQKLNLQVASLTPRMELQIIGTDPLNRWLSNALPLLGQQSLLIPEVTALAGDPRLMSQLSPTAQETLQFYSAAQGEAGSHGVVPVSATTGLLIKLMASAATTPPDQAFRLPHQEISGLLLQLAQSPAIPANTAEQAARLAGLFAQGAGWQEPEVLSPSTGPPASAPVAAGAGESGAVLALQGKMMPQASTLTAPLTQLLSLEQHYLTLPAEHPLRQLLAFLIQTESGYSTLFNQQKAGAHMGEYLNRLGITMEHLLADNKPEEAARTLKFALLELSQQFGTAEKSTVPPDQLVQTLELYQLLQMRLANESLSFLPLPFSFLQQGYLLVDSDRSGKQQETTRDQADPAEQTIALHLQLEGLGNVQIDIHRQEDRVTLRFLTENAEKSKFVAGFREELQQWITTGNLESVQFLVGAQEPVRTLLARIMNSGAGMIDTRA